MIEYWLGFSAFSLLILTYQDFKNKMKVDDRKNSFMIGFTIAFSLFCMDIPRWLLISIILVSAVLGIIIGRFKFLGRADGRTITWLFMGYAAIGLYYLVSFFFITTGIVTLWAVLKRKLFKIEKPVPFYIVLLLIHIIMIVTISLTTAA